MSGDSSHTITGLLEEWKQGDPGALDRMIPLVYDELRRMASCYLEAERKDHTLQTTAVVHEAYVRLVDVEVPWVDRVHFYAVAARCMRRILVDHARSRRRVKRGQGAPRLPLDEGLAVSHDSSEITLQLDEALQKLAAQDEPKARMVELHYFGGLTQKQIAHGMERSPKQVERELRLALAWLREAMSEPGG